MKTYQFNELNEDQKKRAVEYFLSLDIKHIIEGVLRFNDSLNSDDTQKRIDRALNRAEKNQTPWFSENFLRDDKTLIKRLESMALCTAEDCCYYSTDSMVLGLETLREKTK